MTSSIAKGLATTCVLGIVGCATVPKDAGFATVQRQVTHRTGQRAVWHRGQDDQISGAVATLLSGELSADKAVQITLLNNRNLQATYEELGVAQAELVSAALLKNPTLTAEVRFPKDPSLPFDIDLTQNFLDLFFLPVRKRIASAQFEATKWRVTSEVINVVAEARSAFYRAQSAEQLVELRQSVLKATDASYEVAKRLHDAGNITDRNLASEQAAHEQAKIDLAKAEAEAIDTREELNTVMGVWGAETQWKLSPRLPALPQNEVAPTGLETLAIQQRADLAAAREEIVAFAQSAGLANSSGLFPEASGTVHWSGEPDGSRSIGPGIELPLPLFNQGQPAIAAAQARLRQSQDRYAALAVQIRSDVRRARNRMLTARAQADEQRKVVLPLRHQIVEQAQLEYNAMAINVFELLQTKQAEIDAGTSYVESLRDYWLARTELEKAVGGRLPGDADSAKTPFGSEPQGRRQATSQPALAPAASQPSEDQPQHQHHHWMHE
jgi:cobalt-zinc-cadmium efflux system outer membrane protein